MLKRILLFIIIVLSALATMAQPANDACAAATVVTIPASGSTCVNGTLAGATDDGVYSTCETAGSQEVWYTFVTTGANNTITVSPAGATPATNLVVTLQVSNCGGNTIATCNASATANGNAVANWAFAVGTQVWVYISSKGGAQGTFQVCISSITSPPSSGKDCNTAVPICNLNSFTTTITPGSNAFTPPCFSAGVQQPTFYQFTVGQTGLLNWLATPSCGPPNALNTEFDWALYDITAGCPGTVIACDYNYAGSHTVPQGMQGGPAAGCNNTLATGLAVLETCQGVTVTAGSTYVIMVDQYDVGNTCTLTFDFTGSTFQLAPTSAFTATPTTGCGSVTASFTNNSVAATSYHWSFGTSPGDTLNVQNPPAKTYSTPGTYVVSLLTKAASGCSDVATQTITVNPIPTLSVNNATICPGGTATLTATPSVTGGTYSWSPGGFNTASINVAPGGNTVYSVTYTVNNCTATATGSVTVANATFTVNAGSDTTICANQTIILHGSVQPPGTYTYQWSPAGTLTGANTLNPIATPVATTNYVLSVTGGGCARTDTVTITTSGVGVPVIATVTPATICPGQQVQLDFTSLPSNCGINYYGCTGNLETDSLGTGYIVTAGAFNNLTMYGNFTNSTRIQMLYTAAELTAAFGPGGGTIDRLAWEVAVFNTNNTFQNFTIKMKCTSLSTLTTWETGLQTVLVPQNVNVPLNYTGWKYHILDSLFDWDGVSNLIVEVCSNSQQSGNIQNIIVYGNDPGKTIYSKGSADQCGGNTAPIANATRPKLLMRMCRPDYNSFNISWSPAQGSPNGVSNTNIKNPTANPTGNQNYTVTVSAGGCAGSDIVSVAIDTSVKVNAGADKHFCPGNNLTLTATPTGTPAPGNSFSYQWKVMPAGTVIGNSQSVTVSPAANTTYVVTLNGGYCSVTDTINLIRNTLTTSNTVSAITCNGVANGKIFEHPVGTAPYTYQWANGVAGNTDSAINLGPGNYNVVITDSQGCTVSDAVTLSQPTAVAYSQTVTHVLCNGASTGSIALTPSGGTGSGYTYQWSNGLPATATVSGLAANNYSVTVRDGNGCSVSGTFTVNQPTALAFNPAQTKNIRCYNGSDGFITVSPTGGTPGTGYTYAWSPNTGTTGPSATGLTAGNYTVTVRDANSCSITASFILTQPAAGLAITSVTSTATSCNGSSDGTATVNYSGGAGTIDILWGANANNQTTPTATGLAAGLYTVVLTDDSLCTATDSVNVTQPLQIFISASQGNVLCHGDSSGTLDITVINGFAPLTYAWSNGATSQDIINLPTGTYRVTVTDAHNCSQSATYTVAEPAAVSVSAVNITNVSCLGGSNGSITVAGSGGLPGGYTYTWAPAGSGATVSNLSAGTYTVTVRDPNNCAAIDSYQVTEPATAVAVTNVTVVDLLCNGASTGSISITAAGGTPGYNYTWSHNATLNSPNATGLAAGAYTVTVTDSKNCTASASDTIHTPTPINPGVPVVQDASCFGSSDGSITLSPTGGAGNYTYTWNGTAANNPYSGIPQGSYNIIVTDANGCSASTTALVNQPNGINTTTGNTSVSCFAGSDGTATVTANGGNGGFSYIWSNQQSTATITGLIANTYYVTVTDSKGCSTVDSTTVGEPANLVPTLPVATQVSCAGSIDGSITAGAQGGTLPYNFDLEFNGVTEQSNASGYFSGLHAGNFVINITDAHSCTASTTATVLAPVADVYALGTEPTSCYGTQYADGQVHINGQPIINQPFQFSLDNGPLQFSGDFFNVSAGVHDVMGVNNFGCVTHLQAIVAEPVNGVADILPEDTTLQLGQALQLFAGFGPYSDTSIVSYNWSPSLGLSCIDCPNPYVNPYQSKTVYTVLITYNDHCTAESSVTILVENDLDIYIPNAFSPNGDGNNDVFMIYGQGIKTVALKVFNRWGEKVFDSESQFNGWDGSYKGVLQNPGVYVYSAVITFLDDKKKNKTGSVTLVR